MLSIKTHPTDVQGVEDEEEGIEDQSTQERTQHHPRPADTQIALWSLHKTSTYGKVGAVQYYLHTEQY